MSIFDIFNRTPAGAAANPTVPGNTTPAATPGNMPAAADKPAGEASPLEQFSKLWETAPAAGTSPTFTPDFTFDPSKVGEAAAKLDFKKVIDPAQAKAALAGDMNAFMEVLNKVAQAGFGQAVTASGLMSQEAAKRTGAATEKALPEFMRRQAATSGVQENPFFTNPAVAPVMTTIQSQIAATYPNATAAELQKYTQEYFGQMAEAYAASTGQSLAASPVSKTPKGENWENYFGL